LAPIVLILMQGSTLAGMDPNKQPNIAVRVRLENPTGSNVVVQVGFRNEGSAPFRLWKRLTLPEGKMDGERFNVTADGQPVEYLGRTVKRSPPGPDEFIILAPRQVVTSKIVLNEYYAIPPRSQIHVTYEAFNPSIEDQPLTQLQSNTAAITVP
jgi:hypothetical protein